MPCSPPRITGAASKTAAALFLAAAGIAACASGNYVDHTYHGDDTTFRTGVLPDGWKHADVKPGDLVFVHQQGGTILANATCKDAPDVPVDVLTNYLLFDMQVTKELEREPFTLDGRGALRTHVIAELDGVPVELDLVVVRKNDCTYDLSLISGPEVFPLRRADFDEFIRGFEVVERKVPHV